MDNEALGLVLEARTTNIRVLLPIVGVTRWIEFLPLNNTSVPGSTFKTLGLVDPSSNDPTPSKFIAPTSESLKSLIYSKEPPASGACNNNVIAKLELSKCHPNSSPFLA